MMQSLDQCTFTTYSPSALFKKTGLNWLNIYLTGNYYHHQILFLDVRIADGNN